MENMRAVEVLNIISITENVHQINMILFIFFKLLIDSVKFQIIIWSDSQIRKWISFGMGYDGGIVSHLVGHAPCTTT